jgi:hypothetical protein
MFETKEELLMAVMKCLPNPDLMCNLDFTSDSGAINFKWRGDTFRVMLNGEVEEVLIGGLASYSNCAILLRALLKNYWGFKVIFVTFFYFIRTSIYKNTLR